jgi:hypothetical protein
MRHKLAVFSVPFALVLGFESLLHMWDELPKSCVVLIPEPWSRLLTAMILAGGITWLRFRSDPFRLDPVISPNPPRTGNHAARGTLR